MGARSSPTATSCNDPVVFSSVPIASPRLIQSNLGTPRDVRDFRFTPSDPGAADKGLYWNFLPFGEFLWIRMGIHLRIYEDSPNGTEFQGMNRTPFFDPKKGVPY